MTNTKPTWEEEFNVEFSYVGWIPEHKLRILKFIQKVHDEAYERGKKEGENKMTVKSIFCSKCGKDFLENEEWLLAPGKILVHKEC